jgi:acyl transferase domain-containing protein/surfactin synthase thioesterase subunit/aryl carrier-like protein
MSSNKTPSKETLLKRSLHTIRTLKKQLSHKTLNDPIAVTGMACRFPGDCSNPEKFFTFLKQKGDGIIDIPADRWDNTQFYDPEPKPGKIYIQQAGFLKQDVKEFDARFFKISPAEAREMDPQHRLLLEVTWEALERAGENIEQLKGSKTGVFVGILGSEYDMIPRDPYQMNPYTGTGTTSCIASGRVSYMLGVHGPSVSINTACSSSLVSVLYACDALQSGQCDMAIAGGVNLMLSPAAIISLCQMRALATDGRCKPFDADGDGYGRAEGCGVLILKRLSDAEKNKDQILSIVHGGAINHDGPSSGLTVPSKSSQKNLIIDALKNTHLSPEDIGYLEAHGTGTSLGDPIEIDAINDVFASDPQRKTPLIIGSVKGNIGHVESAAGIAGIIKTILCLNHKEIPPNIHLKTLNPRLQFDKIPIHVPKETLSWDKTGKRPRIAGISAFGFSGTNAHVILSEPPEKKSETKTNKSSYILSLSAKSNSALKQLIQAYITHLNQYQEQHIEDICFTANNGRTHLSHRAAVIASDKKSMIAQLESLLLNKEESLNGYQGKIREGSRPKIAFLFNGNTAHIFDLGKKLYQQFPLFKQTIHSLDKLTNLDSELAISSWFSANKEDEHQGTNDQEISAICLFALTYGLSSLLESWGIRPTAVYGEKIGVYAAACFSGIMSPEVALTHVSEYSKMNLQNQNAPSSSDEKKSKLANSVSQFSYNTSKYRFVCASSGQSLSKKVLTAPSYWQNQAFSRVETLKGIEGLNQLGCTIFIEIGAMAELIQKAEHFIGDDQNIYLSWIQSEKTPINWYHIPARLYCEGINIQWDHIDQYTKAKKVTLPTYPFERKSYWIETLSFDLIHGKTNAENSKSLEIDTNVIDPLTGKQVFSLLNKNGFEFQYQLNWQKLPELKDTHGILHVGYYQEILRKAMTTSYDTTAYVVEEIEFLTALVISEMETKTIHLFLDADDNNRIIFQFFSKDDRGKQWNMHVRGHLSIKKQYDTKRLSSAFIQEFQNKCRHTFSGLTFYQMMHERGIRVGSSVQWVEKIWCNDGEALASFCIPRGIKKNTMFALSFHPGVLDACAQVFHAPLPGDISQDMRYMVVKWRDIIFEKSQINDKFWCHILYSEKPSQKGSLQGSIYLYNESGEQVMVVRENHMKGVSSRRADELTKIVEASKSQQKGINTELITKLESASLDQQQEILTDFFRKAMADILEMSYEELDPEEPLSNLGMDSLVGLRFKTTVEENINMMIQMEDLIIGPSISKLVSLFLSEKKNTAGETTLITDDHSYEKQDRDIWFSYRNKLSMPKMRLFCLPYGGRGASLYRKWQDQLPGTCEVCPIQLPGRENRFKEIPPLCIEEMTDVLENILKPDLDLPYAFYGHSAGGLMAFWLAAQLEQSADIKPFHLFVGGFSSPPVPNRFLTKKLEDLKKNGFQGIPKPEEITNDCVDRLFDALVEPGYENMFERTREVMVRSAAALKMVESHYLLKQNNKSLTIPITAFHGKDDPFISENEIDAWKEVTSGAFQWHVLPGNHYFLHQDQSETKLLELINKVLRFQMENE